MVCGGSYVKVQFARTGGFAGMRLMASVDTETLPPEEADRLRRLIARAAFFEQLTSLRSATPAPDRFQYRVTVEEGDRRKTVELDESSIPKSVRPLLDYLVDSARAGRRTRRP